jgi:hypothetical protein
MENLTAPVVLGFLPGHTIGHLIRFSVTSTAAIELV